MAKMIPTHLTTDDEIPNSERKLFEVFKEKLDDDYTIFCGVRLRAPRTGGGVIDREIDFLLAHRKHGLLSLEVKGGRIEIDGKSGQWFSRDRNDELHDIQDPVEQVRRASYDLRNELEKHKGTKLFDYAWYGVALPDSDVETGLDLATPRNMILDKRDLHPDRIAESIERAYGHYSKGAGKQEPKAKGIKDLEQAVARTWFLRSHLATDFEYEEEQIKRLTDEQVEFLENVEDNPRALIVGCAGSGKTMLAMTKAHDLAEAGKKVLFTCYNKNLSEFIQGTNYTHDNLTVQHFHSLCFELAKQAGSPIEWPEEKSEEESQRFWSETVPQALMDATDKVKARFDAIIVDEAQDFETTYWEPLQLLLKDPDEGFMYVFYDDSQRIYSVDELPFKGPRFKLTKNLRNTREIGEQVKRYHQGQIDFKAAGPESGRKPEIINMSRYDTEAEALEDVLESLADEKIPPHAIVLLTTRGEEKSQWKHNMTIGDSTLVRKLSTKGKQIAVQTIQAFKGLERPVVILSELEEGSKIEDRDSLLYVALSRAKNHVIVLGELPEPDHSGN